MYCRLPLFFSLQLAQLNSQFMRLRYSDFLCECVRFHRLFSSLLFHAEFWLIQRNEERCINEMLVRRARTALYEHL